MSCLCKRVLMHELRDLHQESFITSSSSSSEDSGTVPVKATCICRMSYFTKSVTLPLPAMDFCFRSFRKGATFTKAFQ